MAVVLTSEESSHFSSGLRRSYSQPKIGLKQAGIRTSSSASRIQDAYRHPIQVVSDSTTSSAPLSPSISHTGSHGLSSSPKPALDIPDSRRFDQLPVEEHFTLPRYDDAVSYFDRPEEDLEPPPSPRGTGDSYTVSDNNTSTGNSRPTTPDLFFEHAEDDTAVRAQPSRHVDYLSHDWREEDIWESWKYIVSRRGEYSNSARLENASWRTWMKSKNKLRTISPETLNWLKDCDVTWLYGPLQTGSNILTPSQPTDSLQLSKSNSFISKKPILKKRSMSEVMLQRSLSASSLIKQAAAAVQAQQKEGMERTARPRFERAATDYVTFPFSSRRASPRSSSFATSSTSSGAMSPSVERKHIHFNEQVEQCIAVDVKGDDDDDAEPYQYGYQDSDSDDDGVIMMKRSTKRSKRPVYRRKASTNKASNSESKTIAMLPATTLKYRSDTPEPPEQSTAMKHSYRSPALSPSSSQETLRPAKKSSNFFMDDEDEDEEDDEEQDDSNENASLSSRWRSPPPSSTNVQSGLKRSSSTNSISAEPAGMRRTESGMLMPYEEGGGPKYSRSVRRN